MKKMMFILTVLFISVSVQAKTLIVYYSFTNNVHRIVSELQTQIEADVLRVEPAEEGLDYAADNYALGSALISAIRNDPDNPDSYPAISTTIDNLDDYDTIIIGAPLWWSNMAAPLQTFLFKYGSQMAGKRIGLIVSSASSGISGVEADARRLVPDGVFMSPSLWIRSSQTSGCRSMISEWLEEIDYANGQTGLTDFRVDESPVLICNNGHLVIDRDFHSVSIFGIGGSRILTTSSDMIDMSCFPSGIYIAQIMMDDRSVACKIRIDD